MSHAKAYDELNKIAKGCNTGHLVLALSYFFDIGYDNASKITDDDIANAKGNGIMTQEFVRWLMKTARQVAAVTESAIDVVMFCMAEDIFDIRGFAGKLGRSALEDMINTRIEQERSYPSEDTEYFEEKYGCDIEDFAMLGYDIPDTEEEEA